MRPTLVALSTFDTSVSQRTTWYHIFVQLTEVTTHTQVSIYVMPHSPRMTELEIIRVNPRPQSVQLEVNI